MKDQSKFFPLLLMLIGIISIVMGIAFFSEAIIKKDYMQTAMRLEKVKLGDVHVPNAPPDEIIDNGQKAQEAGDTIRSHRRKIAPSYEELLGGKHFDPTNPKQLTYAQALNMENYLYLAVLGFGLVDVVMACGGFMILMGIGIGGIGIRFLRLAS